QWRLIILILASVSGVLITALGVKFKEVVLDPFFQKENSEDIKKFECKYCGKPYVYEKCYKKHEADCNELQSKKVWTT
ncbi:MAG: hypothetical protein ACE5J5_02375, partial [Candidatus Hydrothermarchaeales archaeon]